MPTAHDHDRRPNARQSDDSQQLASLAALLAANPTLNPTAAIRSLGVDRPADIRRLRTKFRGDQAKLLADARRRRRPNGVGSTRVPLNGSTRTPLPCELKEPEPAMPEAMARPSSPTSAPFFLNWCDMSFGALSAAAEVQSALTMSWLHLPPVSMALRAQLALSQVGVAVYARTKKRSLILH